MKHFNFKDNAKYIPPTSDPQATTLKYNLFLFQALNYTTVINHPKKTYLQYFLIDEPI